MDGTSNMKMVCLIGFFAKRISAQCAELFDGLLAVKNGITRAHERTLVPSAR